MHWESVLPKLIAPPLDAEMRDELPVEAAEFADFYDRAAVAAKTALDASQAGTLEQFKPLGAQLRASCDGCHAKYMVVEQPKP